jgi:YbbR domain-containing protein
MTQGKEFKILDDLKTEQQRTMENNTKTKKIASQLQALCSPNKSKTTFLFSG